MPAAAAIPLALGIARFLGGRKKEDKVASYLLRKKAEEDRYAVQLGKARRRARANYANSATRAKGFKLPDVTVGDESVAEPNPGPVPKVTSGGLADSIAGGLTGYAQGSAALAGRGSYSPSAADLETAGPALSDIVGGPVGSGSANSAPDFPVDYSGIYLRPRLRNLGGF